MPVDQLIRDGHVLRIPGTRDRRVINIAITVEGKRHFRRASSRYKESVTNIRSELDMQDLDDLCGVSRKNQEYHLQYQLR